MWGSSRVWGGASFSSACSPSAFKLLVFPTVPLANTHTRLGAACRPPCPFQKPWHFLWERKGAAPTAGCPPPHPQEPCNGCCSAEGHRSRHLGWGKVRSESVPRLAFPWMAAPMPSICPDCCVQTEPPFVPPQKPREPVAALQPLPSPATNSCCCEGRVLGSTCCHHSCRETPAPGGWKDPAGNVRFAKLSVGQGLWAAMGRQRGDGDHNPWDAEWAAAAEPTAAQSQVVLQHYQAGGYLWLIPSYVERPGLESPWSRVLAVLCASSHGTGALREFQPCPGEQCRDGIQHCWSWH